MPPVSAGLANSPRAAGGTTRVTWRAGWTRVGAPSLFLLLSLLWFGRWVLAGSRSGTLGTGPDVQIFIWGLRWWPYAIQHGLDPVVSKVVWPPYGSGVLWTTTVPLLGVIAAPVTLAFGPATSWNLLCILAPALSAWAAYWLCLELSGAVIAATAGGLLFGFSSYELAETSAHLQVAMIALVPLAGLVAARYARGRYTGPGLAARVGGIAVAQFVISPEILVTMVLMAALTGLVACLLLPGARSELRAASGWTVAGLAAGGVLCLPLLIPMLNTMPSGLLNKPAVYSLDLLNFIVPTRLAAVGGGWAHPVSQYFTGNAAEQGGYLGLPLLVATGLAASALWRSRAVRLLVIMSGLALLLSLGPHLQVRGGSSIWLPASLLTGLPGLKDAIPGRFALYTSLGVAILVALWLARLHRGQAGSVGDGSGLRGGWRWLLVLVALICLIPSSHRHLWWRATPQWIVHNDLHRLIPAGETVVWLPFWGVDDRGLYGQAADGMAFKLDDSWFQVIPAADKGLTSAEALRAPQRKRAGIRALRRDLCRLGAGYVVVQKHYASRPKVMAPLHIRPVVADGLLVYRLPRAMCSSRNPT